MRTKLAVCTLRNYRQCARLGPYFTEKPRIDSFKRQDIVGISCMAPHSICSAILRPLFSALLFALQALRRSGTAELLHTNQFRGRFFATATF